MYKYKNDPSEGITLSLVLKDKIYPPNIYIRSNTYNDDLNMESFEIILPFSSICAMRSVRFLRRVHFFG